ncbi:MAG: PHP domain-containing protein [Clostridiales bacterium]|mgnify:CR=1 FL=1|nr:PHP domain-containing protein [Clostridiales bacterium]
MFIKVNENINKELSISLEEVNEINRKKDIKENNFIILEKKGDKVEITTMQNLSKIGEFPMKDFWQLKDSFNYRNSFVGEYLKDKSFINVVTFVDLHGHTGYSLLDGMTHIKDFVDKTVYSRAITDHGVMYGCLDFYKKMKASHKKPIIGFEAYTENIDGEPTKNHLVLLVKNEVGYRNLSTLCTLGQQNQDGEFPKRPIVKYEWLKEYNEGIICLSACLGGEIAKAIANDDYEKAKTIANNFKSIYGDDFYLEIQRHYIDIEEKVNEGILKLGKELGIKVVATTDTHYAEKEHAFAHEVHLCNRTKKSIDDPKRYKFDGRDYHIHTIEEMEMKFNDVPETLYNTLEIVDKCNFDFKFGEYKLPNFDCPDGKSYIEYLRELAWEGFYERFPVGTSMRTSEEYLERMEFELETIENMGYPSYFLIVWDFIKFARENGIPTGPGRGSACGLK